MHHESASTLRSLETVTKAQTIRGLSMDSGLYKGYACSSMHSCEAQPGASFEQTREILRTVLLLILRCTDR